MNDITVKLWYRKADNDFKAGKDELATENPATDTVCFHMQQCVEKYLKAFLVHKGKEISKTHNLALLIQQCTEIDSSFQKLKEWNVAVLTAYAVGMRYPDDFYMPTNEESKQAVKTAEQVRAFVLSKVDF